MSKRYVWLVYDRCEPDLFWVFSSKKKALKWIGNDDNIYDLSKEELQ